VSGGEILGVGMGWVFCVVEGWSILHPWSLCCL